MVRQLLDGRIKHVIEPNQMTTDESHTHRSKELDPLEKWVTGSTEPNALTLKKVHSHEASGKRTMFYGDMHTNTSIRIPIWNSVTQQLDQGCPKSSTNLRRGLTKRKTVKWSKSDCKLTWNRQLRKVTGNGLEIEMKSGPDHPIWTPHREIENNTTVASLVEIPSKKEIGGKI